MVNKNTYFICLSCPHLPTAIHPPSIHPSTKNEAIKNGNKWLHIDMQCIYSYNSLARKTHYSQSDSFFLSVPALLAIMNDVFVFPTVLSFHIFAFQWICVLVAVNCVCALRVWVSKHQPADWAARHGRQLAFQRLLCLHLPEKRGRLARTQHMPSLTKLSANSGLACELPCSSRVVASKSTHCSSRYQLIALFKAFRKDKVFQLFISGKTNKGFWWRGR